MKKLILFTLFIFSYQPSLSQNPLEWFDTSRCHMATSRKLPIDHYPIIYKPKLPNLGLNTTKYDIPYSFWEQVDTSSIMIKMGVFKSLLSLSIPHQGTFLLVIQDTRRFSLLVLEAKATRLEVKGFFDCSIHY